MIAQMMRVLVLDVRVVIDVTYTADSTFDSTAL